MTLPEWPSRFTLGLALLLALGAVACRSQSPEAKEGEARLRAFLESMRARPGDGGATTAPSRADVGRSLVLTDADVGKVFGPQLQEAAVRFLRLGRKGGLRSLPPMDATTEIFIASATTEELASGDRAGRDFPRGWMQLARRLPPGQRFYHVTLAQPGKPLRRLDEMTFVNGHWALLPRVWRVLNATQEAPAAAGAAAPRDGAPAAAPDGAAAVPR